MNWTFVPGRSRLSADKEVENGGVGGRWPASTPIISSYMIEFINTVRINSHDGLT